MGHHPLSLTLQTALCLFMFALIATSCEEENPLQIAEPDMGADVAITRLDSAWFDMSAVTFRAFHESSKQELGDLYGHYIEDVLHLGSVNDSNLFSQVRRFVTDPAIAEVHAAVQEQYEDLHLVESELETAWNYYQYYFPDHSIPTHATFIGGFNTPAAMSEGGIGIGLEMFLGAKSVYYEYLQLPLYLRSRMTPQHLIPTVLKGWVETEFPLTTISPTLLEAIIHEGKVLYTLDAILPNVADSLKIMYSADQMAWAEAHQSYVWAHFIDKELLFSTNSTEVAKFTNDGPFTVDLVKESPPRMGHYIGWMIVREYMRRQDKIDLPLLMRTDAEEILNESKYKP